MGTSVKTTDAERPKRTSSNKLDKFEIGYVKERCRPSKISTILKKSTKISTCQRVLNPYGWLFQSLIS